MAAADWARAVEILSARLERSPEDLDLNLAMAEAALGAGDLRRARRHADRALGTAPKDTRAAEIVGHVLFRMGESAAERLGDKGMLVRATFADAATAYEEALALGSDPYQAGFWAAEAHERAEARDKALVAIDRALTARPKDPAALSLRGRLLLDQGKAAEALESFEAVLAGAPQSPAAADAAAGSISARLKLGDKAGIAAAFPKLTKGDPLGAQARIYEILAAAYRGTPAEDAWQALLETADATEPRDAINAYYRAELMIRRGRSKEALELADRYLAAVPGDAGGLLLRAVALRKLGSLPEARKVLGRAYDLDPERPSIREEFRYLVAAFFEAKRYQEASEVQEFVVYLTGRPEDRHDYAILRLDAGAPAEAERIYREIAADREVPASEVSRALNALALLQRGQKKLPEAEKTLREALATNPDNLDARENLGILLIDEGRAEEGRKELSACIAKDPARKRAQYHLLRLDRKDLP
jgi:tetratricopeptide (TPR) repeat protein